MIFIIKPILRLLGYKPNSLDWIYFYNEEVSSDVFKLITCEYHLIKCYVATLKSFLKYCGVYKTSIYNPYKDIDDARANLSKFLILRDDFYANRKPTYEKLNKLLSQNLSPQMKSMLKNNIFGPRVEYDPLIELLLGTRFYDSRHSFPIFLPNIRELNSDVLERLIKNNKKDFLRNTERLTF